MSSRPFVGEVLAALKQEQVRFAVIGGVPFAKLGRADVEVVAEAMRLVAGNGRRS